MAADRWICLASSNVMPTSAMGYLRFKRFSVAPKISAPIVDGGFGWAFHPSSIAELLDENCARHAREMVFAIIRIRAGQVHFERCRRAGCRMLDRACAIGLGRE
jgi:hypothetical protein